MNRYSLVAIVAAVSLALAGCSSSSKKSSSPPKAGDIVIKNFAFSGKMTVKAGQKVTVTNRDSTAHTLTDKKTHKFDTGNIDPGATKSFTAPSTAGSYPFGCDYHPEMHGTLVVQ
jgi:plastocyanin